MLDLWNYLNIFFQFGNFLELRCLSLSLFFFEPFGRNCQFCIWNLTNPSDGWWNCQTNLSDSNKIWTKPLMIPSAVSCQMVAGWWLPKLSNILVRFSWNLTIPSAIRWDGWRSSQPFGQILGINLTKTADKSISH